MEHVPHLPTLQAIYAQTHVSYRGDDDHLYSGVGDRIVNVECHTYPEENHQRLSPLRVALSTWNSPVAVQLRSRAIIAACQSQPTSDRVVLPSDRADIGSATSIRVLDSTLGLCEVDPSESAALIRSEGVLVVGGDSFDTIVSKCGHIQHGIESRMPYEMYTTDLDMSSSAPTDGSFMFDLSLFNAEMYSGDAVDQVMPGAQVPSLSMLPELSHLSTLPQGSSPSPSTSPFLRAEHILGTIDSPMAGLQNAFNQLRTESSPWGTNSSTSSSSPPSTGRQFIHLGEISPAPPVTPEIEFFDSENELQPNTGCDFCGATYGAIYHNTGCKAAREAFPEYLSPAPPPSSSFDSDLASPSVSQNPSPAYPHPSLPPVTHRRNSVNEPTRRVGQKSKRGASRAEDDSDDDADDEYVPDAATRIALGLRPTKRFSGAAQRASAPPTARASSISAASTPTATPALAPISLPRVSPVPPAVASSSSAPAPRAKPKAKAAKKKRARRPKGGISHCRFCHGTFTRDKDRDRHEQHSCNENPDKQISVCPECGECLSRPDSARRHLKVHEDKGLPPPKDELPR